MNNVDVMHELWGRLPLILLFANGYLVYRLLEVTGLSEIFVHGMVRRSRGRAEPLLFYIIVSAAALSLVLSNTVTMLAMLPLLGVVDREARKTGVALTTPLALAAIYGGNIGGMGSLIGSPANLLLLGALEYYRVPGREAVNFGSWLVWALPLAALFSLAAWGVARLALPKDAGARRLDMSFTKSAVGLNPWQRSARMLVVLFLVFWVGLAVARSAAPGFRALEPAVAAGFFAYFVFLVFFRSGPRCYPTSEPLLRPRDLVRGLPLRGLAWLGVVTALILGVRWIGADRLLGDAVRAALPPGLPDGAVVLALILAVLLATELVGNTVVSLAFFAVAREVALARGMDPLPLMIAVSLASTCAFMTPVATPCNALAFGEMRGTRLSRMLGLGLLLNVIGALLLTGWVLWVLPFFYGR